MQLGEYKKFLWRQEHARFDINSMTRKRMVHPSAIGYVSRTDISVGINPEVNDSYEY